MKSFDPRLVAIILATSFALMSSLVIAGLVWNIVPFGEDRSNEIILSPEAAIAPAVQSLAEPEPEPEPAKESTPPEPPPKPTEEPTVSEPDPDRTLEILDQFPDSGPRMVALYPSGIEALLPMVRSDYSVDIRGDLATVSIEQTFENPSDSVLDAVYQIPMSENAAVYEMIMQVGDRRIRAEVREKEEARETFEQARSEGRAAALLEQQRANLFTQRIANLMPNQPVRVTIRYVENVEKIDGRYQMVVPLVVGPRYEPADMSGNQLVDSGESVENERVVLPMVSELVAPETIDPDRIGLKVRLDGGVTVGAVDSPSHSVATSTIDPRTRLVELAEGRIIGNRHFVLTYELEGESTQAGLLTHWNDDHDEGYFSLLVEPPARPKNNEIAAREMVFLLDNSGSMRGAPMDTSKAYMRHTLRNLRPDDTFHLITFASKPDSMSEEPLLATEENIERGLSFINNMNAAGGTEVLSGIKAAFGGDDPQDRVRIVTILHDGYFGNEYEVIRTIRRDIGDTRLVVLGVGAGPNRYIFQEMARAGRGFSQWINPADLNGRPDAIRNTARAVAHRLETPVLTDISIDWGELTPRETTPERIPDLFAGQSIRIMGRYSEPGDYEIEVRGRAGTEQVSIPLQVHLAGEGTDGRAVELTWARSRVDDYMHLLLTPHNLRQSALEDSDLKTLVTDLGLTHDIATKWTSFVAVSEDVVNPNPGENLIAAVPEPQVDGVPNTGYATMTRQNAAPEPGMLIALLMALLMGLGLLPGKRLAVDRGR